MNKRIQELADEAGFVRFSPQEDPHTPIDWSSDYSSELEKFAELIVKECCFTGEQYADALIDPKHYAFVNKKVKEHFGVEE